MSAQYVLPQSPRLMGCGGNKNALISLSGSYCKLVTRIISLIVPLCVTCITYADATSQWCMIDDPGYFRDETQKVIDNGGADFSDIKCPKKNDPHSLPDEIQLPMPCSHKMLFRKVSIDSEHLLDQKMIYLGKISTGNESDLDSIFSGPRELNLSGGFSVTQTDDLNNISAKIYYIGKYEVTEPQYALFKMGVLNSIDKVDCAIYNKKFSSFNESRVYPASKISWYDAVEFTRAYNRWLIKTDNTSKSKGGTPSLPWEQGSTSFVRLPTESEWEFAARGGDANQENQGQSTYKIMDVQADEIRYADIEEITSTDQGAQDSPLSAVGTYLKNMLGLYDMVGNAEEIVFEPYHVVRPQQDLHGQVGGYIVKGGLPGTIDGLGVGERREIPFFTDKGESRGPTVGFRLALSVPIMTGGKKKGSEWTSGYYNQNLEDALIESRTRLSRLTDENLSSATNQLRSEIEKISALNDQGVIDQEKLRSNLALLKSRLEQAESSLHERNRDIIRERVKSAVLSGYGVSVQSRDMLARLLVTKQQAKKHAGYLDKLPPKERDVIRSRTLDLINKTISLIKSYESALESSLDFYSRIVLTLAKQNQKMLADAFQYSTSEFSGVGDGAFDKYINYAKSHIQMAKASGGVLSVDMRKAWFKDLDGRSSKRGKILDEISAVKKSISN